MGVKPVVFELDDLCDEHDPFVALLAAKAAHPGLRCTLFAIPTRCSDELLEKYRGLDWVEVAVHGYHHAPMECAAWGPDETVQKVREVMERPGFVRGFKAPGWIAHQEVYPALEAEGFWVADHGGHVNRWGGSTIPRYVYNAPRDWTPIHGHTWDVCGNGPDWWTVRLAELPQNQPFRFVSQMTAPFKVRSEQEFDNSWGTGKEGRTAYGLRASNHMAKFIDTVRPEGPVVDFGGNDGTAALVALSLGVRCTVIDESPSRIAAALERGADACCSLIESVPFEDGEFEWGFTSHTLEHVDNLDEAWAEIKRVCRRGCWVVVPIETEEEFEHGNSKWGDKHTHKRYMGPDEWCEYLSAEKVSVTDSSVEGSYKELVCLARF